MARLCAADHPPSHTGYGVWPIVWPVLCDLVSLRHHSPGMTLTALSRNSNGCYFRQSILFSTSCLSRHLISLAIRSEWLFCCFDSFFVYCFPDAALALITSRHSAPCDAPQVDVALGKITPLVIMFVGRLPGIWASWQHHTLAGGGVGIQGQATNDVARMQTNVGRGISINVEKGKNSLITEEDTWWKCYPLRPMWLSPECRCWGYTRSW